MVAVAARHVAERKLFGVGKRTHVPTEAPEGSPLANADAVIE
jgi:hypothetical protein